MNLSDSLAFEQIHVSSFQESTLVSFSIPQINHYEVISLDSSNNWRYTKNIMQDISIPLSVSSLSLSQSLAYSAEGSELASDCRIKWQNWRTAKTFVSSFVILAEMLNIVFFRQIFYSNLECC